TCRLLLSIASIQSSVVTLLDINQAYLQSDTMTSNVYLRPAPAFGAKPHQLMKLQRPLHGLSDAGDAWDMTFKTFLNKNVGLSPLMGDPSAFYSNNASLAQLLGVFVDDVLIIGSDDAEKAANSIGVRFSAKAPERLLFTFAGNQLEQSDSGIVAHQRTYLIQIHPLSSGVSFESFRRMRHKLAWLSNTRPDILAGVNILSQTTDASFKPQCISTINKIVRLVHSSPRPS
ncbi:MAG: reverse transcriptase domain-containing protein, partial [Pseudomonadota bacterium]